MEVRWYHMFGHMNWGDIPWNLGLKHGPKIDGIGTSNKSVPVAWPLINAAEIQKSIIKIQKYPETSGRNLDFSYQVPIMGVNKFILRWPWRRGYHRLDVLPRVECLKKSYCWPIAHQVKQTFQDLVDRHYLVAHPTARKWVSSPQL